MSDDQLRARIAAILGEARTGQLPSDEEAADTILHLLRHGPISDFPNRIRELRIQRGLSQDDVAERAHCSKAQISDLERGKRGLDLEWMRRIASVLEVTPGELLSRDDNPLLPTGDERDVLEHYRNRHEARVADRHEIRCCRAAACRYEALRSLPPAQGLQGLLRSRMPVRPGRQNARAIALNQELADTGVRRLSGRDLSNNVG